MIGLVAYNRLAASVFTKPVDGRLCVINDSPHLAFHRIPSIRASGIKPFTGSAVCIAVTRRDIASTVKTLKLGIGELVALCRLILPSHPSERRGDYACDGKRRGYVHLVAFSSIQTAHSLVNIFPIDKLNQLAAPIVPDRVDGRTICYGNNTAVFISRPGRGCIGP